MHPDPMLFCGSNSQIAQILRGLDKDIRRGSYALFTYLIRSRRCLHNQNHESMEGWKRTGAGLHLSGLERRSICVRRGLKDHGNPYSIQFRSILDGRSDMGAFGLCWERFTSPV